MLAEPQVVAPRAQDAKPIINMDAVAFNPNANEVVVFSPDYQSGKESRQSAEVASWQENIDRILNEAKKSGKNEIPISELIEDPNLVTIQTDYQKDIRFICNNTGRETSS